MHPTSMALWIGLAAIAAPCAAAPAIHAKAPQDKSMPATGKPQTLSDRIDGMLRAPVAQSIAGSIMSPANASRVSITVTDGTKNVTVTDTKLSRVAGQWTITNATTDAEITTISAAVLQSMGLQSPIRTQTLGKSLANKTASDK